MTAHPARRLIDFVSFLLWGIVASVTVGFHQARAEPGPLTGKQAAEYASEATVLRWRLARELLDQLGMFTPDDIVLRSVRNTPDHFVVQGDAPANARISVFMRNLVEQGRLFEPNLTEVRSGMAGGRRVNAFSLDLHPKFPFADCARSGVDKATCPEMPRPYPASADLDEVLSNINALAIHNALDVDLLKPLRARVYASHVVLPVEISLNGGFNGLRKFAYGIGVLPNLVILDDLALQSGADGALKIHALIEIYRWKTQDEELGH